MNAKEVQENSEALCIAVLDGGSLAGMVFRHDDSGAEAKADVVIVEAGAPVPQLEGPRAFRVENKVTLKSKSAEVNGARHGEAMGRLLDGNIWYEAAIATGFTDDDDLEILSEEFGGDREKTKHLRVRTIVVPILVKVNQSSYPLPYKVGAIARYIADFGVTTAGGSVTSVADKLGVSGGCTTDSGKEPQNLAFDNTTQNPVSLQFTDEAYLIINTGVTINHQSFTCQLVCDANSLIGGQKSPITLGSGASSKIGIYMDGGTIWIPYSSGTVDTGILWPSSRTVFHLVGSPTDLRLYINGELAHTAFHGQDSNSPGGAIGAYGPNNLPWAGNVHEVVIFNQPVSAENVALNAAAASSAWRFSLAPAGSDVFVGDSISYGQSAAFNQGYIRRLSIPQTQRRQMRFCNPGQKLSNFDFTQVDALASEENTFIGFLHTNDVFVAGMSGADLYDLVQSCCEDRRTAGYGRIVWIPMLSRGGDAGKQAARQVFLDLMDADHSFVDAYPSLPETIFATDAHSNAAYFVGDHIHLTDLGHQELASAIQSAILV